MSTVTSMGYKKPATGDRGNVFYPDLEFNIDRQDAHKHDGTDGVKITTKDLVKGSGDILAANWVAVSGQAGTYRQLITVPTGFTVNDSVMKFYVNGGAEDGFHITPSIEKASATTFYVYINDNTLALKVVYG